MNSCFAIVGSICDGLKPTLCPTVQEPFVMVVCSSEQNMTSPSPNNFGFPLSTDNAFNPPSKTAYPDLLVDITVVIDSFQRLNTPNEKKCCLSTQIKKLASFFFRSRFKNRTVYPRGNDFNARRFSTVITD